MEQLVKMYRVSNLGSCLPAYDGIHCWAVTFYINIILHYFGIGSLEPWKSQISTVRLSHFATATEQSHWCKPLSFLSNLIELTEGSKSYWCRISGQEIAMIDVINPAIQEVVSQVLLTRNKEFKVAVTAAKHVFLLWRNTPVTTHQRIQFKLQELIDRDMDKLSTKITNKERY